MFGSRQTFAVDGVARFVLPGDWAQGGPDRQGPWSAVPFRKSQTWHFGSGDPREVEGWVILGSPRATASDLEQGMEFAFKEVQANSRRFPEFGNLRTGTRTTWMSEGNYQIASNHDPEKVIFLRSVDPDKQAALVLRVYERKIKHEKLRAIEHEFFQSLAYQEGRAKYFAEVPLSVSSRERRAEELSYLNRLLAGQGLPLLDPRDPYRVQAHQGWIYQVHAGKFVMARRLGDRPKAGAIESARGELTWLEHEEDAWQPRQPQNPRRPPAAERYFPGQAPLKEWSRTLALDTDRTRRYFFYVWACELTPEDSPESQSPATWELEGWLARVNLVEQQFRAGQFGL